MVARREGTSSQFVHRLFARLDAGEMPMSDNLSIRELSDCEMETAVGGMKNADHPGVQAALNAFYGAL
jgi:hypothetical protein